MTRTKARRAITRRMLKRLTTVVTTAVLVWVSVTGLRALAAARGNGPGAVEKVVSKYVASLMSRYHYSHRRIDDSVSEKLFDEFFDRLDHNRSFLLAADIKEFQSYQTILDDLVLQGQVTIAFDVYERYVQRVRERVAFVKSRLEVPFDFTKDEQMILDRSELPWCASVSELDEVWRKRIKNNMLVYQMMEVSRQKKATPEEQQQEKQPEGEGGDTPDEGGAAPGGAKEKASAPVVPRKTPKERVLQFYERYLRQVESREGLEVVELFLSSLTRIFDPHSVYMAPDTEEDFNIAMKLSLQGIGALLNTEDSFVKVAGIIAGGPAELDGQLKEGDRIIAVAQENQESVDVIDMPLRKVVKMIRGPKGTTVYLTVLEAGKGLGSVPVVVDIVRDEVKLTDQEAKSEVRPIMLPLEATATPGEDKAEENAAREARIGIIYLPSFYADFRAKNSGAKDYKSSTRDVRRLISEAKEKGMTGLILDLRSNGGGSLEEAIELAGLFFPEGPVVQVRDARGQVKKRHDPDPETIYDGPLLVLIDRLSASASEIVAAAIQDHRRGVIVGEKRSHGKGTVQTVFHLDDRLRRTPIFRQKKAGSLKFTMAKFYRVTGGSTQVKGVTPDVTFASFTDHMELGEEHLPHVMPWDEIEALETEPFVDVTPYVPALSERSQERMSRDPDYQAMLEDIERFAERRDRKTLTLSKAKRVELQQEEEAWSEKLKKSKPRKRRRGSSASSEDEQATDPVLDEALQIIGDMIVLSSDRPLSPVMAAADGAEPQAVEPAAGNGTAGQ
ncbi:MAG: carboxy terminal-processing peptidase [Lentisphaerae bacterium]|jgi:carboxyl-terminal processing protease|nr:carboxy terminal-processing peptidase [Lentisphaerota bacterium]MBT4814520.1 carboxy terminal-processing peptidase [Lentisphaerota bacterium]MBT5605196.1 carboxy terminal-processing peptidase [Lentisphaerota bacterium]MBT7054352.1 carboxy terminal-processing peptidase [Lentisphaerota bacterium]MBT7844864.1 carboxy terminal-processing peptidase [Lentisphaerota bacterium]